jgi:hypothetical protein
MLHVVSIWQRDAGADIPDGTVVDFFRHGERRELGSTAAKSQTFMKCDHNFFGGAKRADR